DPLDLLGEPAEDVPDFVDLCAGPTPGEVPEGDFGCPEVGVAGTVLALESDPATEMGVGLEFVTIATGDEAQRRHNPGQVPWGACDWSELPAGRIPVYVLTTRPADVVVEHGDPGRPAGTVEAGPEPGRLRVIQLTLDD